MTPFGPLATAFHEAVAGMAGDDEADWYAQRLPHDAGLALCLMCGYGRVLVPLRARGVHVHGVDRSAAMIAACEAHLAAASLATTLFRQDVVDLNLPFRYASAFVPGGSFQLVGPGTDARKALARLKAHLVPPGLLILDLAVPEVGLHPPGAPLAEVRAASLPDRSRITLRTETTVDAESRLIDVTSRYERRAPDGSVEREDASHRRTWYDEDDIATLLVGAGYEQVTVEASPRAAPGDRRFAVRARAR
jgi:hypothetical protein